MDLKQEIHNCKNRLVYRQWQIRKYWTHDPTVIEALGDERRLFDVLFYALQHEGMLNAKSR